MFKPIFGLLLMLITVLVSESTPTPPPPVTCPANHIWDDILEDCLSCELFAEIPVTTLSHSCKVPDDAATTSISDGSDKTRNESCPSGYGWDDINEDCQPCLGCKNAPNSNFCGNCGPTDTVNKRLDKDVDPAVVAVATAGIVILCVLALAGVIKLIPALKKLIGERRLFPPVENTEEPATYTQSYSLYMETSL
ncbi:hypothetical protein Bbelb_045230 [Branchiostoma belcheri]|nr:hypothetical protein Bbelb_045230 [Branchiostoma belcheri]